MKVDIEIKQWFMGERTGYHLGTKTMVMDDWSGVMDQVIAIVLGWADPVEVE